MRLHPRAHQHFPTRQLDLRRILQSLPYRLCHLPPTGFVAIQFICGRIATVGIRFLWIIIFQIRRGKTSPQALLMATVMLTLIVFAINYSVAAMIAPQYATFGPQTYCDRTPMHPGEQPDCSNHKAAIKKCTELAENPVAKDVCTPSVVSTFIDRTTFNFPFFGVVDFWAQFAFLGTDHSYQINICQLTYPRCISHSLRNHPLPYPEDGH